MTSRVVSPHPEEDLAENVAGSEQPKASDEQKPDLVEQQVGIRSNISEFLFNTYF